MDIVISPHYGFSDINQVYQATMHTHERYEIYCFLEGKAQYCVEGRRYDLSPGDLMVMRKGEVHMVDVDCSKPYRRIGVHFNIDSQVQLPLKQLHSPFQDRPAGKFNHYPARLFPDNRWEFYLQKMYAERGQDTAICHLLPLLCELKEQFILLQSSDLTAEKDPAAPIMKYINAHLTDDLSLEGLSRQFYTSQTHLNRLFRKSVGTTVWKYVTIKRLFLARELLNKGVRATQVYAQCGFADYSTFFRAYKQFFGAAPSADCK